jgi:hypothetical protein
VPFAQLLQYAHDTLASQAEIDVDRQEVTRTIVDDVKGAVGPAID